MYQKKREADLKQEDETTYWLAICTWYFFHGTIYYLLMKFIQPPISPRATLDSAHR